MKKIILIGKTGSGKTTLKQVLKGEEIRYHKTHYVNHHDTVIDTPGEYAETKNLAGALLQYAYEAKVVGLIINATESYSIYPPNVTISLNREVIGIVTQIDRPNADSNRAERWLRLAGCKKIYKVCAITGEGIIDIIDSLKEDYDSYANT